MPKKQHGKSKKKSLKVKKRSSSNPPVAETDNKLKKPASLEKGEGITSPLGSRGLDPSSHFRFQSKVQNLLHYGQYSIFKDWNVLVEGDFIQKKFIDPVNISTKKSNVAVCGNQHQALAFTDNWLLICEMENIYRGVDGLKLEHLGKLLTLQRIVPVKYLTIDSTYETQTLSMINSQGLKREYRMKVNLGENNQLKFRRWEFVVRGLKPYLGDDVLLETLELFQRWKKQHMCRLVIESSK